MIGATMWVAGLCAAGIAGPAEPVFRAQNGIWTHGGQPFIGTTAHAIHHTFRRDPQAAVQDLRGLAEAGFNTAEVYWIWDRDLREDGTFDFAAFDEFVLACRDLGLLNFAAIMHHCPAWLAAQHGWFHLDEDGEGPTTDGFYVCDPTFRQESDRFVMALLEHLADHPEISENILYFALGGEYYPFQPDRDFDTGYEEATVTAFREWLREHFTLAELGERWNADATTYADWEEVWPAVRRQRTDFRGRPLSRWDAAAWDWYDFRARQVKAFFEHTLQLVREQGGGRPVTHELNVRAPGQRRLMRWDALAGDGSGLHLATMDFASEYDYANMLWWIALSRGCSHPPQQNNEFTGYASYHWLTRHAWATHALGGTGLTVWDWRSSDWGLVRPNGTPRDGLAAARRYNAEVRALGERLADSRPLPEQVSILMLDEEDFWRPHAHETEVKQLLARFMEHGLGGHVNVVTNSALSDSRLNDTRLLIVPGLRHVRAAVAERLAEFVRRGGVLWLLPGSFAADELNEPLPFGPAPPLDRVAGVRARPLEEPVAPAALELVEGFGGFPADGTLNGVLLDEVQPDEADILMAADGRPALTLRRYGRGICLYQATAIADLSPMLEGWQEPTAEAVRELAAARQRLPDEYLDAVLSLSRVEPAVTVWKDGNRADNVLVSARPLKRSALVFLIDLYNQEHSLEVRVGKSLGRGGARWHACRLLPEDDPLQELSAERGFSTHLAAAEVQLWLVGPASAVAKGRRDLLPRQQDLAALPAPPPADPQYPAKGEVVAISLAEAPKPRPLGDGWLALDLTAHANRSLVEDPKATELDQFVTQRFEAEVTGGRLDLTFHAESGTEAGPFWVVNALEIEAIEGDAHWRFDSGDGPLAAGYEGITEEAAYSGDSGHGWTDTTGLASRDRESPAGDALRRDFVLDRAANADHTFRVHLPDGKYRVTVTAGDADFHWGPMSVLVDGQPVLSGLQPGAPSLYEPETERRRSFFKAANNDLRELRVGRQVLNGVPFHIPDPDIEDNCCLVFASRSREVSRLVRAEGIAVGRQGVAALHFLHGAGWNAPTGTPIGRYVAHYGDGTRAVQQIVVGVNIGSWWGDGEQHGPACEVAWVGDNPGTRRYGTHCVLYQHRWANPHPEKRLVSLDVEGYWLACNPFVIAVTGEMGEAGRHG